MRKVVKNDNWSKVYMFKTKLKKHIYILTHVNVGEWHAVNISQPNNFLMKYKQSKSFEELLNSLISVSKFNVIEFDSVEEGLTYFKEN